MADKISQLPAATGLADTDIDPIVQGGITKSRTLALLKSTLLTYFSAVTGTWAITSASVDVHPLVSKTTPVDVDEIPIADSAATWGLKKLTWANLKATLFASPTFTGIATLPSGSILGGMSAITNSLAADVALNNSSLYFDGPSVAQGTVGTWFVSGNVVLNDPTGTGGSYKLKLWDGTTVIDSAIWVIGGTAANQTFPFSLSGSISSPSGNLRISVNAVNYTTGAIKYNASGSGKDSTITAIRIG